MTEAYSSLPESQPSLNERLEEYLHYILEVNQTLNLTAISDYDKAKILHIEDSLVGKELLDEAPKGLYADMGTGGGFPGVPLGLASGRQTLLIDSRQKKIQALKAILLERMNLSNFDFYAGRVEELTKERKNFCAAITARAMSSLPSLMELAAPLLIQDGLFISYHATGVEELKEEARLLQDLLGLQLVHQKSVTLSDGETPRTVLVFQKISEPSLDLPRRVGLAQKHPLTAR